MSTKSNTSIQSSTSREDPSGSQPITTMKASDESFFFRPFQSLSTKIHHVLNSLSAPVVIPLKPSPFSSIPRKGERRTPPSWSQSIFDDIRFPGDQDNITISKVRWFKYQGGLGHECLIFTIDVAEPAYIAFVGIQRSTEEELVRVARREKDPLSQVLTSDIIASMSGMDRIKTSKILGDLLTEELKLIKIRRDRDCRIPGKGHPVSGSAYKSKDPFSAFDIITRVDVSYRVEPTSEYLNAECLDTLTFENKPGAPKFCLRDLSLMVREMHGRRPNWSLKENNSYWFARTLVDVMTAMKDPTTQTPDLATRLGGCVPNIGECGRVVKPNPAEVSELIVQIEEAIRANDQWIAISWEAGEGGRARVADELVVAQNTLSATQGKLADIQRDLIATQETLTQERITNAQKMEQLEAKMAQLEAQLITMKAESLVEP